MKKMSALLGLLLTLVLAGVTSAKPVDQPRMEAARANLLSARSELQRAIDNKGGRTASPSRQGASSSIRRSPPLIKASPLIAETIMQSEPLGQRQVLINRT